VNESADPRRLIAGTGMSRVQIAAVAVTIGLNALDGFDILAISFASPGIAAEWGIDRAALGIVLSMELIGMAFGSILLGRMTDRIGRRPMILLCLAMMAPGMLLATTATSIVTLSAWRVFTGIGIGGMLAATNAAVAEHANDRHRNLCVSLMVIGYPIGAVLGGSVAGWLLQTQDWRAVFYFGAAATAAFIPLVYFLLPETVPFLCRRGGDDALDRVNRTLARMGKATVSALPPLVQSPRRLLGDIFQPALVRTTALLTFAYFTHIATFYFILKWVPKIVVDMGFAPSSAAGVLVWANVGGALGGVVLGLLSQRIPMKPLAISVLLVSTAMVSWFGRGQAGLAELSLMVAIAGFFTNAGVVALYSLAAERFPTEVRATGTGFVIGLGRGGAALSPIVAGLLFQAGVGLQGVAVLMSLGATFAALAILLLRPARDRAEA
jgi:benzoate transport